MTLAEPTNGADGSAASSLRTALPTALRDRSVHVRLAGVPAMVVTPESASPGTPAGFVLWLHGRTVFKELDPGRYLRWMRAGIGTVALDLPGHGERTEDGWHSHRRSLDVIEQAASEVDGVLEALRTHELGEGLDHARVGIGGMSLGGMAAIHRLTNAHAFRAALLESTTGDLECMYLRDGVRSAHDPDRVRSVNPARRLDGWRPIPVLALHSEADPIVPWSCQKGFLDKLRALHQQPGATVDEIEARTWAQTGAPDEHSGFGKVAAEAKSAGTAFFVTHLTA